jgi:hypothetical protein
MRHNTHFPNDIYPKQAMKKMLPLGEPQSHTYKSKKPTTASNAAHQYVVLKAGGSGGAGKNDAAYFYDNNNEYEKELASLMYQMDASQTNNSQGEAEQIAQFYYAAEGTIPSGDLIVETFETDKTNKYLIPIEQKVFNIQKKRLNSKVNRDGVYYYTSNRDNYGK